MKNKEMSHYHYNVIFLYKNLIKFSEKMTEEKI